MRTIYITLFFIVNLFSVCLYAADDAAGHTEQGHQHLDNGQYDQAIQSYTLALDASTDNDQADDPEVLSGLGDCYKAQEQYANAIKYYAEAVQASPHDGLLSGQLGDAYIASDNVLSGTACFESAVDKLKEQVAADPTDICLLTNLGCYSQKIGNFDDAIKSFKQALSLTNDNNDKAYIQYEIGRSYQEKKEYNQAIVSLTKAAQLRDVPFVQEALTECIDAEESADSTDGQKQVDLPIPNVDSQKQAKPSLSTQPNPLSRLYSWLWPTPKESDDTAQQDKQPPAPASKSEQKQAPPTPEKEEKSPSAISVGTPPSPLVPQTPTTAPSTTPAIVIDSTVPVQESKAVMALPTALVMAAGTAITLTTFITAIRYHLLLRAQRQKLIARTIPTDGAKFASYSKKRALFAATTAALALATLGAATLMHRQSQNAAAAA